MIPRRDSALIWSRVQVVVVLGARNGKQLADKLVEKKYISIIIVPHKSNWFFTWMPQCALRLYFWNCWISPLSRCFKSWVCEIFSLVKFFSPIPLCSSPGCCFFPCYISLSIRVDATCGHRWQYLSALRTVVVCLKVRGVKPKVKTSMRDWVIFLLNHLDVYKYFMWALSGSDWNQVKRAIILSILIWYQVKFCEKNHMDAALVFTVSSNKL